MPSPIGLIQTEPPSMHIVTLAETAKDEIDEDFKPFVTEGYVLLVITITILRDTGAKQSILHSGVSPISAQSYCGADILAWGVGMSVIRATLHFIQLSSKTVSGKFQMAVHSELLIA